MLCVVFTDTAHVMNINLILQLFIKGLRYSHRAYICSCGSYAHLGRFKNVISGLWWLQEYHMETTSTVSDKLWLLVFSPLEFLVAVGIAGNWQAEVTHI